MIAGPSFSAPVTAAGAVVWRGTGNACEVVVVHHPHGGWSFPNRRTAPGEHMAAAAVRAVSETAGPAVPLGLWLGATDYVREGWPEHVDYFAAEAAEAAGSTPAAACTDPAGVDDLLWLPPHRAADALSRPDDVRILHEFRCRVRVSTTAVVLMRGSTPSAESILSAYGAGEPESGDDLEGALRVVADSFATGRPAAIRAECAAVRELLRRLAPMPVDATVPERGLLVLHGTPERVVAVERHLA